MNGSSSIEWIVQKGFYIIASAISTPLGWLTAFLAMLWSALGPGTADGMWIALLVLFVGLDTLCALWAARSKGLPITLAKARQLIPKIFGYMILIGVSAWVTIPIAIPDWLKATLVAATVGLLVGYEGLSVLRHLSKLGFPVSGRLIAFLESHIKTALSEESETEKV